MRNATSAAVCSLLVLLLFASARAEDKPAPSPVATPPQDTHGNHQQLFEAWLASDAAVLATYRGVDSTLGSVYHVADIETVWSGSPVPGRVVFKAPRGIRAKPGDRALLMLWERLAGAPDSYIEESRARYGDKLWPTIGPDSITTYLLPFAAYAYRFDGAKLFLRGGSAFPVEITVDALAKDFAKWETEYEPRALFGRATVIARARVQRVQILARTEHGIITQRQVEATLQRLENIKGVAPDPLHLAFPSFPRSPRFREKEEVIVFLTQGPNGLYLEFGKRGVFHVEHNAVLETGQTVGEFNKALRTAKH